MKLNDITIFYHINMNVLKYLKNDHNSNIIQSEFFLNDESLNNCIKLMFKFYAYI